MWRLCLSGVICMCFGGGFDWDVWLLLVILRDYEVSCLFFGIGDACDGVLSSESFIVDCDCAREADRIGFLVVGRVLFVFVSSVDMKQDVWSVSGDLAELGCDVMLYVVFVWLDLSKVVALLGMCLKQEGPNGLWGVNVTLVTCPSVCICAFCAGFV